MNRYLFAGFVGFFAVAALVISVFYSFGNSAITGHVVMGESTHDEHIMSLSSEQQFIREMIPHHQEAIDTSKLMLNSDNPAIRDIASRIVDAQLNEIAQMKSWYSEWYPGQSRSSTYIAMMPDLTNLSGKNRDKAYLEGMIAHHKMAVDMAHQLHMLAKHPEMHKMASDIITTQSSEISEMKSILGSF
jgi:uncharacterized protein (DUF305 family)